MQSIDGLDPVQVTIAAVTSWLLWPCYHRADVTALPQCACSSPLPIPSSTTFPEPWLMAVSHLGLSTHSCCLSDSDQFNAALMAASHKSFSGIESSAVDRCTHKHLHGSLYHVHLPKQQQCVCVCVRAHTHIYIPAGAGVGADLTSHRHLTEIIMLYIAL